jgi:hypothetical protein
MFLSVIRIGNQEWCLLHRLPSKLFPFGLFVCFTIYQKFGVIDNNSKYFSTATQRRVGPNYLVCAQPLRFSAA